MIYKEMLRGVVLLMFLVAVVVVVVVVVVVGVVVGVGRSSSSLCLLFVLLVLFETAAPLSHRILSDQVPMPLEQVIFQARQAQPAKTTNSNSPTNGPQVLELQINSRLCAGVPSCQWGFKALRVCDQNVFQEPFLDTECQSPSGTFLADG